MRRFALAVFLLLPSMAQANDSFFPLAVSNRWEYGSHGGVLNIFIGRDGNEYIFSGDFLADRKSGDLVLREYTGPDGKAYLAFVDFLYDKSNGQVALRADLFPEGGGTEGQVVPVFEGNTGLEAFDLAIDYFLPGHRTEAREFTSVLEIIEETTIAGITYFRTNYNQLLRYDKQDRLISYSEENNQEETLFDFSRAFGPAKETLYTFSPLLYPFSWKWFGNPGVEGREAQDGDTVVRTVTFSHGGGGGYNYCNIRFEQGIGVIKKSCGDEFNNLTWRLRNHTLSDDSASVLTAILPSGWGAIKNFR